MVQLKDQATVSGPRTSDGIVILTVQRASGPHPHPNQNGRIVPFNMVSHLLLANGQERYRCDWPTPDGPNETCGKDTFTEVRSVPAHMATHTSDRSGPKYPEETIRNLVRTVRAYRQAGHSDFTTRATAELNRLFDRYPTLDGEPWTVDRVSGLFHRYRDVYRTHVRQTRLDRITRESESPVAAPPTPTPTSNRTSPADTPESTVTVTQPAPTADAATNDADRRSLAALDQRTAELVRRADQLLTDQRNLSSRFTDFIADFAEYVGDVGETLAELAARPDSDPEVSDKARRWDEMQALLGR